MKIIIDQPFGIGDILFLTPLVSKLEFEIAVWPVVDHYIWIKDYIMIDNLVFIKNSEFNRINYLDYVVVPFRDAHDIISNSIDCMQAKYKLFDVNLDIWRNITFKRNTEKELELKRYLKISPNERLIYINNHFAGPEYNYVLDIQLNTSKRIIKQEYIDGFTLLDWCGILEQSDEIHTVSTSLFFVIESLKLQNVLLYLYPRKPLDKDLSPIKSLINSNWICHE